MLNQRVLVVDDEADFRMVIGKILKDEHFVVLEAGDGEQAAKDGTRIPSGHYPFGLEPAAERWD